MRIDQVRVHKISLPFSINFSHALRDRSSASNIIVEVIADHGEIKGYGEGAPRSYVTGESQKSAVKSLSSLLQKDSFPWQLNDVFQVWDFVDSLPVGKQDNAAICALELALLDALGKRKNRSIIEYFPGGLLTPAVQYGTVVPLASRETLLDICEQIRKLRISRLRLKMGKDLEQNRETSRIVKGIFGEDCDLRADVNGAWDYELAAKHVPVIRKYKVKVVEQPMMPHDPEIAPFAKDMKDCGVMLMADESACTLSDMKRLANEGHYGMVNVRLSKCGGFRRSLKIIDYLRNNGISFQIGCQLGESGILSAAGRALSLCSSDAVYHDGSYDEFLLKENITEEHVSFGMGGVAGPLEGPGLGVEINYQNLGRLTDPETSLTIKAP